MGVSVPDVPDGGLVELVQGWEQVYPGGAGVPGGRAGGAGRSAPGTPEPVPDEIACALVCTRRAAEMLMVRASLATAHPAVRDAWMAGSVDARKVDVLLARRRSSRAAWIRTRSCAGGLAVAGSDDRRRADPLRTRRRAGNEPGRGRGASGGCAGGSVDLLDRGGGRDGVAVGATCRRRMPSQAFTVIDALAGTTRTGADQRTADQRRADAFGDLFTQDSCTAHAMPDGTPLPRRHGQAVSRGGGWSRPRHSWGDSMSSPPTWGPYGPITAPMARELAQDGDVATDVDRPGHRSGP